jgi:transposase
MLPREYPPWKTVYHYFRRWSRDGTWEKLNARLRERLREAVGRAASPSGSALDSQSVKTTESGGERGFDGHKKVKGRKRHVLTDTQGLLLKVKVLPANVADSAGARRLLEDVAGQEPPAFPRMAVVWADRAGADAGVPGRSGGLDAGEAGLEAGDRQGQEQVRAQEARAPAQVWEAARERARAGASVPEIWAGFSFAAYDQVIPRRWVHTCVNGVVERTFAWLGKSRRLAKDWERLPQSSEAWSYVAMIRLMLRRLSGAGPKPWNHYR